MKLLRPIWLLLVAWTSFVAPEALAQDTPDGAENTSIRSKQSSKRRRTRSTFQSSKGPQEAPAPEATPVPPSVSTPLSSPAPVDAAPPRSFARSPKAAVPDAGPRLRWGAGLTGLIAVLGLGTVAFARRRRNTDPAPGIELVARRVLGPRCQVVLLRIREREFLLTTGEGGTAILGDWGAEPENPAEVEGGYCPNPRSRRGASDESPIRPGFGLPIEEPSPAVRGLIALREAHGDQTARWFKGLGETEA